MNKILKTTVSLSLLLFTYLSVSQTFFSTRLNIGGKINNCSTFKFYNDTFYIPAFVIESFGPAKYSVSLLKVTNTGSIIAQKRFKPANESYIGETDLCIKNNKFYIPSITSYGYDNRTGFFVFSNNCDTIFTKSYGDTTYYNLGNKIRPFKITKNQLLIFGLTDSTCGTNHPSLYKPIIRVVDTNGVLKQTKLYLTSNKYRTLLSADTTINKGYVFCGTEIQSGWNNNDYIIKLDSNLNTMWVKYLDTSQSFCSIVSSKRGGYYFASTHTDSTYLNSFYWERVTLKKLDANGNVKWRKIYGAKQEGIGATNIKELSNGDIVICGSRQILYSSTVGQLVGFMMRTDSLGNLKWWKNYIPTSPIKDTAGNCYLNDIIEMPDKGLAAVGYVGGDSGLGTIEQSWLLRVDSMGCLVSGCTSGVGIEEFEQNISLVNIYPNPASNNITIDINEKLVSDETFIEVYNNTGQFVQKEKLYSIKTNLQTAELAKGMYLFRIVNDKGHLKTNKIIILH